MRCSPLRPKSPTTGRAWASRSRDTHRDATEGSSPSALASCQAARPLESYTVIAPEWHTCGMARIRLSTTVDASLLEAARGLHSGPTDAALVDDALRALLARNRAHEIDAGYAAYDEKPTDQPDEWGDLDSWRRAASAS